MEIKTYQTRWNHFKTQSLHERLPHFSRNNRLYDILFAQQFDRPFLDFIFELTNKIRIVSKIKTGVRFLEELLHDKRAMLYFEQPSTRTFLSFMNACYIMGIKTCEIRDRSTSSELKGESIDDTLRTFSSYVDLIIIRHSLPNIAERSAWHLNNTNRPVPVINGGSGQDQHPTQALLDIYTLMKSFEKLGGLDGKTIAMVGDLKRGRTVRSLTYLTKNFANIKLLFVSPPQFRMESDILTFLDRHAISYQETDDLDSAVREADAIYMTRIQDEHDTYGKSQSHYEEFSFKQRHLSLLRPTSILMHPFPRRGEIDIDVDIDPRAKYWRQERNGMWVRAALLAYLFNVDKKIMNH